MFKQFVKSINNKKIYVSIQNKTREIMSLNTNDETFFFIAKYVQSIYRVFTFQVTRFMGTKNNVQYASTESPV